MRKISILLTILFLSHGMIQAQAYSISGSTVNLGGGCFQLTANSSGQTGGVWDGDDVLDFTVDWSYDFTVNLGNNNGGADGMELHGKMLEVDLLVRYHV